MVTPAAKTKATDAGRVLHPPASVVAPAQDSKAPSAPTLIQRQVALAGGTRPQTPPEQLSPLLGQGVGQGNPQVLRQLQQGYGNQYVGRVIQAKLSVSQPGDRYEQEADRVADWVMRMAEPQAVTTTAAPPTIQRLPVLCEDCEGRLQRQPLPNEKKEDEDENQFLRKATPGVSPRVSAGMEGRLNSGLQGGQPLAPATRAFFEPRFGRDFSQVRVHQDAGLAKGLNAQAFTVGNHVVFGAGRYQPETPVGKKLLAHELTHVVQQGNGTGLRKKAQRKADLWIQRQELANSDFSFDEGSFSESSFEQSGTGQSDAPFDAPLENQNTALLMAVYSKTLLPLVESLEIEGLPEIQEEKLQQAISGTPTYELIKKKNEALEKIRKGIKDAEFWESKGGVEAWKNMEEEIVQKIPKLQSDVDRLNSLIESNLRELGVETEEELLRLVEERFPETWMNRAKKISGGILELNASFIRNEKERYIENLNEDIEGLRKADQQIYDIFRSEPESLFSTNFALDDNVADVYGDDIDDDYDAGQLPPPSFNALLKKYDAFKTQFSLTIRQIQNKYPVLSTDEYRPGIFIMTSSFQEIQDITTLWLDEKLENIEDTIWNIGAGLVLPWDLELIRKLTFQSLGVAQESILGRSVNNYLEDKRTYEEALKTALLVFEFIATIAATIVGTYFGQPWLGLVVGLAFGAKDLVQSIEQYKVESSAENIGLGPLLSDISTNDPDAFAIVLALLSLGFEFAELDEVIKVLKASSYLRARDFDNLGKELIDKGGVKKEMAEAAMKKTKGKFISATDEFIDPPPSLIHDIEYNIHHVMSATGKSKLDGNLYDLDINGKRWHVRALDGALCYNPCIELDETLKKSLQAAITEKLVASRKLNELLLRLDDDIDISEILEKDYILHAFEKSPELLDLTEKHGDIVLKILERNIGEEFSSSVVAEYAKQVTHFLNKYDQHLVGIEGADNLLKDLAAGNTTFWGAMGELQYIRALQESGEEIIRISDLRYIDGELKKAADILLEDTVVEVKNWSLSAYKRYGVGGITEQLGKHVSRYPDYRKFRLVLANLEDIPREHIEAIEKAFKELKKQLKREDLELEIVDLPTGFI